MTYTEYIIHTFNVDAFMLKKVMVGRSIREINPVKQTITLDNDAIVKLQNTSDGGALYIAMEVCDRSAWYHVTGMEAFDFQDNIITDVVRQDNDETGDNFTFKILSHHKTIAEVSVDGHKGSANYYRSINMSIRSPEAIVFC